MLAQEDHFAHKAKDYEKEKRRVDNVKKIADSILKKITFTSSMNIMDFGSGTGLLSSHVAPLVMKVTCIDMSKSMNEIMRAKADNYPCELEVIELDLSKHILNKKFDSIISSMTMHHIEDISDMFKKFYEMLHVDGTIAIADLESEDGTFHTVNTGVYHNGFDKDSFLLSAKEAGFKDLKIEIVSITSKGDAKFPIFLLTAKR